MHHMSLSFKSYIYIYIGAKADSCDPPKAPYLLSSKGRQLCRATRRSRSDWAQVMLEEPQVRDFSKPCFLEDDPIILSSVVASSLEMED